MEVRFSEAWYLLVAAGLHAALPLAAALAPALAPEPPGAPIEVAVEIDVPETRPPQVEAPSPRPEAPRSNEDVPPVPRPEHAPSAANVPPGPLPTSAPSVEPPATGAPPSPAVPSATSEYGGPPPSVPGVAGGPILTGLPGLGGPAWSVPGAIPDIGRPAPAPTTLPAPTVDRNVATRVLKEAMKEKDKALGLDLPAAGSVASAIKSAMQASDLPAESRGTIEVRLSPTGQVISARCTSSTGGSAASWAQVAAAAKSLAKLSMTSEYAKGAVVVINVSSTLTMPDGTKSVIQQKGAGATFDVANIGSHLQRVTRVTHSVVAVQ